MAPQKSLQQTYTPNSICYGCGPANDHGLKIESFINDKEVIATWNPKPYHHSFPNVLNGGVIGTLFDCHCNWAAAWHLMQHHGLTQPPRTVTAKYEIKLLRPVPMDTPIKIIAKLERIEGHKAFIKGKLFSNDKLCDTCLGTFVSVPESHPAYHRW